MTDQTREDAADKDPRDPMLPPRAASLLGYAGVIPFITAAVIVFFLYPRPEAKMVLTCMIAYGAVILSFLGGIRWALAMLFPEDDALLRRLALATAPSLLAWLSMFVPAVWGLVILLGAFWGQAAADLRATRLKEAPQWYGGYRIRLSILVFAALAVSLFGLVLRS